LNERHFRTAGGFAVDEDGVFSVFRVIGARGGKREKEGKRCEGEKANCRHDDFLESRRAKRIVRIEANIANHTEPRKDEVTFEPVINDAPQLKTGKIKIKNAGKQE
jgi:hypothetical protein